MFVPELTVLRLEIDFSEAANQVTGVIDLAKNLPENFVILHVFAQRLTGLTSAGAATLLLGNDADDDGYVAADIRAQTLGDVVVGKGALVYDAVDKHHMPYPVLAANVEVKAKVGTAAITAGKVAIYVHGFAATQH